MFFASVSLIFLCIDIVQAMSSDLEENAVVEWQVVVLAGGTGLRLYPLCEGIPKALLPIDNKPLIAYQLQLLERHGFRGMQFLVVSLVVSLPLQPPLSLNRGDCHYYC